MTKEGCGKELKESRCHKDTWTIDKRTLIRIFKMFKRNKNKTFVQKDFFEGNLQILSRKYLGLLISIGLVEQVEAIWMKGHHQTRRITKGYRLK